MSDPVAEAAANLAALSVANMAAQGTSTPFLDQMASVVHDLEAKVEHLIHPESVPNVTPESPATDASATLSGSLGQSGEIASSVKPSESLSTEAPEPASATDSAEPSMTIPTSSAGSEAEAGSAAPGESLTAPIAETGSTMGIPTNAPAAGTPAMSETSHEMISSTSAVGNSATGADLPNVLPASTSGIAEESTLSADSGLTAEVPNAVSGAAESTTVTGSASPASGSGETSSIGANSGEPPLHVRVAAHLEAIFSMVKEAAPTPSTDTIGLKTHVGEILHRMSNGMAVTEGELVQKLESLYRML